MVVRAIANGTADNEHRRENLYGGNPSSTYFKQLDPVISTDTAISEGEIPSRYNESVTTSRTVGSYG